MEQDFIKKITGIIEENISDEQFGVSELAAAIGMSRSNLLRKIKKQTGLSASRFISQVRLERAVSLLKKQDHTVSEVSFKVGFNSTSYFIKCFRELYGYPPGEMGRRGVEEEEVSAEDTHKHHLAAIMFTDIQGYTALMQKDEKTALDIRDRHRMIFNTVTEKYNGKILQYYGDGTLSTFSSAIDAVRCGIELQYAFLQAPGIPVRIGIHSGDIIFTDDDIIGDGVNVASRIEALSCVGSVLISEKVYDEVKNQSKIQTTSLGVFQLKNVDRPIEVFAIVNPGLAVPSPEQLTGRVRGKSKGWLLAKWLIIILAVMGIGYLLHSSGVFEGTGPSFTSSGQVSVKKSIAVLPFINDSDDSTNVYFINGLMESTLNDLQKIKDLRVISRTSVEKYRHIAKTIPEIARDLNVKYIVEGSGQKIGDQIMLHIQLIDAPADRHLWSKQYRRESSDIFQLQMEVANDISNEIEAIITPEEKERIRKIPTDDLLAYDFFLKGQDLLFQGTLEGVEMAIPWFAKAIKQDPEFAHAYADISISYFYLEAAGGEGLLSDSINYYADQALLFDPKLPQSLIAKALFFLQTSEYDLAVPYLEKALEYSPNSAIVIQTLSEFYARYLPDTEKYLMYALKGIQLDIASHDSGTISNIYLHLSNAFIQSGFVDEAEKYIKRSLDYNPDNLYSDYVGDYIRFAKDRDLNQLKDSLTDALRKDTSRLDILQEVGKVYYYLREYEASFAYYSKFNEVKDAYNLNIYPGENAKIALVLDKVGLDEESEKYFQKYKSYADADESIYKNLSLAAYYSYHGDAEQAIEFLRLFSLQDHYHYWMLIFIEIDPLFDNIQDLPEFRKILDDIETRFWEYHSEMRASLEDDGLI